MGEISRLMELDEEVDFKGEKYLLSPMVLEVQGQWEQYLEDRAFDALYRQKKRMNQAEYDKKFSELIGDVAAGKYSFLSEHSIASQSHLMGPGFKEMLYIRLKYAQPNDPRITRKLANDMAENNLEKLKVALAKMDTPDPNSDCPPAGNPVGEYALQPSLPGSSENPSTAA